MINRVNTILLLTCIVIKKEANLKLKEKPPNFIKIKPRTADRLQILLMQVPVLAGTVRLHHQLAGMALHQVLEQPEPDHVSHHMPGFH